MAFAASKRKRIGLTRKGPQQLRLTSMIDMFTILLIYLLKSYSPTETPSMDPNLRLPVSISTKVPIESTIVQAAKNMIIVDGRPVLMIDPEEDFKMYALKMDANGRAVRQGGAFVAESEVVEKEQVLPGLYEILVNKRKQYEQMATSMGKTFKGEITVMGDKDLPYKVIKKLMATAGKAGFGDFKFAAVKNDQG